MYKKNQIIHFVGIGGVGMSGIAEVLKNLGYKVQGSDIAKNSNVERLEKLGVKIFIGHSKENVKNADIVVKSSAIKDNNPEIVEAHNRGIPVIPRAEMLAELMRMKYSIAVAGSHGKTTTTSMIGTILNKANFDPTIVIGGKLDSLGSNAKLGKGEFLVAEADESDGSFLYLTPTIAVITNIDEEHLDHYKGGIEEIKNTFVNFANKIPFYGVAVVCLDHPNIQEILPQIERRHLTYGFLAQADVRGDNVVISEFSSEFDVYIKDKFKGRIKINMPGLHNVYNALGAIAVGYELEIEFSKIKDALDNFGGVNRRFYLKGYYKGAMVIDDYGHHPEEIKATLKAVKEGFDKRVIVVFQPHRYSRTKALLNKFAVAFYNADKLIITDIYPAGEEPIKGINSELLYEKIKEFGHKDVVFIKDFDEIVKYIKEVILPEDIVITLGAGNIWKIGENLLKDE